MEVKDFLKRTYHKNKSTRHWISCNDGYNISVQASGMHYSTPEANLISGDYECVEVALVDKIKGSEREPKILAKYFDDGNVYAKVPIYLVEAIITLHEGINFEILENTRNYYRKGEI